MKKITILLSLILLLAPFGLGFKEAILNKGLEIGMGYVYNGFGFEIGFEQKMSDKIDLYPWLVLGGIGNEIGFGIQVDLPINVFKQSLFSIAVGPFVGMNLITPRNNSAKFNFDMGGYGLFSFDFRKESVPISFSIGFGPDISFSAYPSFRVFYTVNISIYLDGVIIQVGGNSKFAGLALKIPSISY
ncbi:MAG: hypothetical protein ACK4F9_03480 [Brevinematia bacterium]